MMMDNDGDQGYRSLSRQCFQPDTEAVKIECCILELSNGSYME